MEKTLTRNARTLLWSMTERLLRLNHPSRVMLLSGRVFNKWEWDADGLHDGCAIVIQRVWRGYCIRERMRCRCLSDRDTADHRLLIQPTPPPPDASEIETLLVNQKEEYERRIDQMRLRHVIEVERLNEEIDDADNSVAACTAYWITEQKNQARESKEELYRVKENLNSVVRGVIASRDNWSGQAIRLKWMIDEMERVGAIRLPDHDWATDMAKSIEYPDTTFENGVEILGPSIFQNISQDVKRKYLPSYEDAHMEHVDDEEEADRIREWSLEARVLTDGIPQGLLTLYDENPGGVNKVVIMIQKHVRGHRARQDLKSLLITGLPSDYLDLGIALDVPLSEVWRVHSLATSQVVIIQRHFRGNKSRKTMKNYGAVVMIQKIYRGYRSRGIRYYRYTPQKISELSDGSYYGGSEALLYKGTASALTGQGMKATGEWCSIKFFNTGVDGYKVSWVHNDGSDRLCNTMVLSQHSMQARPTITFPGHWFCIKNLTTGDSKMIRINRFNCNRGPTVGRRVLHWFFNVHTGLSGVNCQDTVYQTVKDSLVMYTEKYCAGEYDDEYGIPPDEPDEAY